MYKWVYVKVYTVHTVPLYMKHRVHCAGDLLQTEWPLPLDLGR